MGLKRRTFLQQAGLALLALGASEAVLALLEDQSFAVPLLDRYYQALAQPSARKLALLVGINQYPRFGETRNFGSLQGCVTDVELQRELLIHRFGFHPNDVLTLTDQQATRENIETAFLEHLTQQAVEGDVVVFHFSGYGSRVNLGSDAVGERQNSLVPVDGVLLAQGASTVNDLLEETLLLLLRSLKTDQITTVLDTSYRDAGNLLQGNLRVRSRPGISAAGMNQAELAFQEQLRSRLSLSQQSSKSNQMPGIVLTASAPSQLATEAAWGGFSAGLFTYALTQHLWQAAPPTTVQISMSRTAGVVEQLVRKEQQPQVGGQKSEQPAVLAYNLTPDPGTGADGVVVAVEENGKTVQLWLAGVPTTVLTYYKVNSLMTLLNSQPREQESSTVPSKPLQLQIRAREGLTAKARIVPDSLETNGTDSSRLQVGQLVQESVRVLSRHIGLTIALDPNLDRIERVDATSAFSSLTSVSSVVTAGEQPADYLFGKLGNLETKGENVAVAQGYGLFFVGGDPIPNTVGEVGEAVKSAVNRLKPKLKALLAAKLLRLTANEGSSHLGVRATLEMLAPSQQALMQRETLRASFSSQSGGAKGKAQIKVEGVPKLFNGSRIQYQVENYSDRPVYLMLLGLDSSNNAIAFYPLPASPEVDAAEAKPLLKNTVIPPGQTLTVPQSSTAFEWMIQGSSGLAEIYLVCSLSPFTHAIAALEAVMRPKGEQERISDLFNPLDVARAVLQDLHQASLSAQQNTLITSMPETSGSPSDSYALDINVWATLSFVYQVV